MSLRPWELVRMLRTGPYKLCVDTQACMQSAPVRGDGVVQLLTEELHLCGRAPQRRASLIHAEAALSRAREQCAKGLSRVQH
eukprot:1540226-Amphidinium_carterae.1